jgi:hypothetical protein
MWMPMSPPVSGRIETAMIIAQPQSSEVAYPLGGRSPSIPWPSARQFVMFSAMTTGGGGVEYLATEYSACTEDDLANQAAGLGFRETVERRQIVNKLVAKLEQTGWKRIGRGAEWYSYQFRRSTR